MKTLNTTNTRILKAKAPRTLLTTAVALAILATSGIATATTVGYETATEGYVVRDPTNDYEYFNMAWDGTSTVQLIESKNTLNNRDYEWWAEWDTVCTQSCYLSASLFDTAESFVINMTDWKVGEVPVTISDLPSNITKIRFYETDQVFFVSPETPVSTVPVPAAAWLFGSGLLGLVGVARRKTDS